jgi:hypothetical protein
MDLRPAEADTRVPILGSRPTGAVCIERGSVIDPIARIQPTADNEDAIGGLWGVRVLILSPTYREGAKELACIARDNAVYTLGEQARASSPMADSLAAGAPGDPHAIRQS